VLSLIFLSFKSCIIKIFFFKAGLCFFGYIPLELIDKNISIKYLLCLLNSKLLNYYFQNIFSNNRTLFPIMKSGNIEGLPICLPIDNQKSFIDLADTMLSHNLHLHVIRKKFLKRLTDNLTGIKIIGVLENFEELDFKQFLSELKKQKITPSLKQQDEWEEYFNENRETCRALVLHINETDNAIDKMVYELYGFELAALIKSSL